ncbi:MAG: peroxiredoxin family protein, partial [Emticicia sp.]|uniref:peroxiredoxin family protein n=1 Tax=Emticicia sp. TaxID=1930953 RepID=UPI003BA6057B
IKKQQNIYELSNMGEKQMKDFVAKESQELESFVTQNKGWNGSDSLARVFWSKKFILENKTIDFVKNNGKQYYSLWLFTNQVVHSHTSIDSLIKMFNTTFPEHFKQSFEGKEALKYLNARNIKKGVQAPNLISKDLKGRTISLDKYRKKYVLLTFWSTTCVPCIAEMPTLVKIKKQYSPQKLDVIAISSDDNMTVLSKAIHKYQMNWTNIADKTGDLFKTYGVQSIPQVYLIDKTGKIVYSREEESDNEPELIVLNKVLAEKLSK